MHPLPGPEGQGFGPGKTQEGHIVLLGNRIEEMQGVLNVVIQCRACQRNPYGPGAWLERSVHFLKIGIVIK